MTLYGDFVKSALDNGLRVDGRTFTDYRKVTIEFGDGFGQAEVTIGDTRVLSSVEAELLTPHAERPSQGNLFINVEINSVLPPTVSEITRKRCQDEANETAIILEKLIMGSGALDPESLCVATGLKVWNLRCDIHVLDVDGNLRDACSLAALASLRYFYRQEVVFEGDECRVLSVDESTPCTLSIHHYPFLVSMACFQSKNQLTMLVDPTQAEEDAMHGKLTIAVNQYCELCGIYKNGGTAIEADLFASIIEIATKIGKALNKILNEALKKAKQKQQMRLKNIYEPYNVGASRLFAATDD